ncbi:unnamed protein product [Zymoseptoria tritici ST99CH_3D1]|nr:unnamed protein product [Zymoseptoria tritici ST99CH_3D1]
MEHIYLVNIHDYRRYRIAFSDRPKFATVSDESFSPSSLDFASYPRNDDVPARHEASWTTVKTLCNFLLLRVQTLDVHWVWFTAVCVDQCNQKELAATFAGDGWWLKRTTLYIVYLWDVPEKDFKQSAYACARENTLMVSTMYCVLFVDRNWRTIGHKARGLGQDVHAGPWEPLGLAALPVLGECINSQLAELYRDSRPAVPEKTVIGKGEISPATWKALCQLPTILQAKPNTAEPRTSAAGNGRPQQENGRLRQVPEQSRGKSGRISQTWS